MLNLIDETLAGISGGSVDLAPRRFGRVVACDGGLIEVSGLGVPIGSVCSIVHGGGQRDDSLELTFASLDSMEGCALLVTFNLPLAGDRKITFKQF